MVHLYAFVAPMLSAEWAWHKMLIIPCPENSFSVFFERYSHVQDQSFCLREGKEMV